MIAFIIIAAILGVGALAPFIVSIVVSVDTIAQSKVFKAAYNGKVKKLLIIAGISGALLGLCALFAYLAIPSNKDDFGEIIQAIIGGMGVGFLSTVTLDFFILHYFGKEINSILDKKLFISLAVSFPLLFVFIFILSNGYADYLKYPLVKGLCFDPFGWVRGDDTTTPSIAFYALCILSGAIYVYFLCDHKFYKEYGRHGILESTFLVAFPAGIIGARIFYVIGQWDAEFANDPFGQLNFFGKEIQIWKPLCIWEGGLTILGGALMGVVVGVGWFMWRKRQYNIWVAVDIIVPTILIAQAVGRWGNFFNTEVHGILVDENYWQWLPKVLYNQMHYGLSSGSLAPEGQMYVPLFFIEGLTNFLGYFVLAHLFGNKLRKYTEFGDLAFGYFIWYGLTRAILEPMRHELFIMSDLWSWFWGLSFVVIGALCIVTNHYVRHFLAKRVNHYVVRENTLKNSLIGLISVGTVTVVLVIVGVILANNSNGKLIIGWSTFNGAVFTFVLAGTVALFSAIPALHLVEAMKKERKSE